MSFEQTAEEHARISNEVKYWLEQSSESEDSLEQYHRQVHHILKQNAAEDGYGKLLFETLDKCCRTFFDNDKYRNDSKLLELFLLYNNFSKRNHLNMFMYLYTKNMFRSLPTFWIEWARCYESQGNYTDALYILSRANQELDNEDTQVNDEFSDIMDIMNDDDDDGDNSEILLENNSLIANVVQSTGKANNKPPKGILKKSGNSLNRRETVYETPIIKKLKLSNNNNCMRQSEPTFLKDKTMNFKDGMFAFTPKISSTRIDAMGYSAISVEESVALRLTKTLKPQTPIKNQSANLLIEEAQSVIENKLLNASVLHNPADPFSEKVQMLLLDVESLCKRPNHVKIEKDLKLPISRGFRVGENGIYTIKKCCGSGAYAQVYAAAKESLKCNTDVCLKVQTKADYWEFHVLSELEKRLSKFFSNNDTLLKEMFSVPEQIIRYNNCSILVSEYFHVGTLLVLINWHVKRNRSVTQWMATFFGLNILKILDVLHSCNIIHADIKPDNLLIRHVPEFQDDPLTNHSLVLIDFNRSIDLELFPSGTNFFTPTQNKSLCCIQMREQSSWKFQIDTFGMLNTLHCIVCNKYISPYKSKDEWKPNAKFPRSYPSLWNDLFSYFLNSNDGANRKPCYNRWIERFTEAYGTACSHTKSDQKNYLKTNDLLCSSTT